MNISKNARPTFIAIIVVVWFFVGCDNDKHTNIVIIVGGLIGSAAAWQLSSKNEKVILIEKQGSVYILGSSFGEARIARSIGPKDDIWSFLHNRNVQEVNKLITYLNKEDEVDQHSMEDVFTTSPVTYIRHVKQMDRIEKQLADQQDSFQLASNPAEAYTLFEAALADTAIMLREYKTYSGTINPQALIKKLHLAIRFKGQEIRYRTKVLSLTKSGQGFEIEVMDLATDKVYIITTDQVICAAGPYNGSVLINVAPYFEQLIKPQRVFLSFLQIKQLVWNQLNSVQKSKIRNGYPVINSSGGTSDLSFFSMIERWEDSAPIIKIGGHFQRTDIDDLDNIWEKSLDQEEINWSIERTATYLAQLGLSIELTDLKVVDGYSCVYSLSKNEIPYVTPAGDPSGGDDKNLIVMGAMSGVGAKGALAYGEIAAAYLLKHEYSGQMENKVLKAIGYEHLKLDIENLEIE